MVRIGSQKFSHEEIEEANELLMQAAQALAPGEQGLSKLQQAIDSLLRKPEIAEPPRRLVPKVRGSRS
jgi:hypothetical protein